jgi:hypothetical protein
VSASRWSTLANDSASRQPIDLHTTSMKGSGKRGGNSCTIIEAVVVIAAQTCGARKIAE